MGERQNKGFLQGLLLSEPLNPQTPKPLGPKPLNPKTHKP